MIPITVITGFLGAGKTTLINKIIKENKNIRFGLIINEFGEVGIDGQILDNPKEEIVEMSDGCLCCVVRSDLVNAIQKMADTGKVDYIVIETSGLAEPAPILQTFMTMKADGIKMDCLLTVIDYDNFEQFSIQYQTVFDQIGLADVIVVNKVDGVSDQDIETLTVKLKKLNEFASVLINDKNTPSSLFIDTNSWNVQKLSELELEIVEEKYTREDNHEHHHHGEEACTNPEHHHHHNHEHNTVTEIVWTTDLPINPHKMDNWLQNEMPSEVIRAKGILQIQTGKAQADIKKFVFQMVGANKELLPLENYVSQDKISDINKSSIVLIGKKLDKESILENLNKVVG